MFDHPSFESGGSDWARKDVAFSPDKPRAVAGSGNGAGATQPSTGYGYGANLLDDTDIHLLDYVKVLYRRRWSAVAAFVTVVLAVCVYTFTATPIYEATVQILIEKENTNVVSFKEAFEQNQVTDDYYQTQYKILQSRALARRAMGALKLWDDPQFNPAPDQPSRLAMITSKPIDFLQSFFKSPKPVEPAAPDETRRQSVAIDRFLGGVTVAPVRNSRLVNVKYESPDPALAAKVANALSKAYIEQNLEFKFMASKEASDWLGERLGEQRKQVEASEQALQHYREQTDAVSLDEHQNIVVQKLADLNAAVTRAKTERIQKEAAYQQIRAIQTDRTALDTVPMILSNGFVQQQKTELAELQRQQAQLSDKLGPRHPDMVKITLGIQTAEAKIQGEIGKVVQSMRNDYQAALAQEQSLTAALDRQKHDALALNRQGISFGALQRDANTNRQIFESLLQRTKETGISGELKTSNIRVVDAAEVPRRPASPNPPKNLLLGFAGGVMLAMCVAFFFEYVDSRIKSPAEIKQHLGLSFLGMVPALFDSSIANPLISNGVPPNFSESFRAVRTNVLFSAVADGGRSLAITSTGPAEGKSVIAANLSIALAQAGQRVLLVDADMRKPKVHVMLRKDLAPGLSNVLVGNAKVSDSVTSAKIPGLWVLPAGLRPPNPAELLGTTRFKDFLAMLVQHFDFVVVDTPPVMAVTDASLVAHVADGVLYVVGSEMTSRHAAQRGIEQLEQVHAKLIGSVLNRVDLKHNSYYYNQYYKREYGEYYTRTSARA
jgi:succinoglycan biosynthesis transport protein ExoP